ncbi:MAG TPA: LPS export ABC transporter periplasmic protein LptC [Methylotenera sp.]|nr:LPS export ABC transporter periplasmic protein LptC [Methylotenera sp.]
MSIHARSAYIFPLVLLSLMALLTFWISRSVQPTTAKLDGSSRHDPDYIVNNFVTTQTDINGDLRYKLAAVEMKHFPDDDSTVLQRPRYTQFAVDKPYTQVEGLRGNVSSNGEQVEVIDNVRVTRQAFEEKGEMTVDTDYLKIFPNEEVVQTPSPVIIRQAPKTVIYATGMHYDKKTRTVTLLNKVKAHYEKPAVSSKKSSSPAVEKPLKTKSAVKENTSKTNNTNASSNEPSVNQPIQSSPQNARIRRRYE